jgi:hypothetical protein
MPGGPIARRRFLRYAGKRAAIAGRGATGAERTQRERGPKGNARRGERCGGIAIDGRKWPGEAQLEQMGGGIRAGERIRFLAASEPVSGILFQELTDMLFTKSFKHCCLHAFMRHRVVCFLLGGRGAGKGLLLAICLLLRGF